jgi:hypothetical protein
VTALHSVVGSGGVPVIVASKEPDAKEEEHQETKVVAEEQKDATPVMIHRTPRSARKK